MTFVGRMGFERPFSEGLHHYQKPFMILSVPRYARAAQHHVGLLIMVSGRSKTISPSKVTLLYYYCHLHVSFISDYRHLGGRLKIHSALKIKAVGRIISLSARQVWAVGPIMTSAARNCILRRMLLNTHYLLDGLGRYHSVDTVGVTKL